MVKAEMVVHARVWRAVRPDSSVLSAATVKDSNESNNNSLGK